MVKEIINYYETRKFQIPFLEIPDPYIKNKNYDCMNL